MKEVKARAALTGPGSLNNSSNDATDTTNEKASRHAGHGLGARIKNALADAGGTRVNLARARSSANVAAPSVPTLIRPRRASVADSSHFRAVRLLLQQPDREA